MEVTGEKKINLFQEDTFFHLGNDNCLRKPYWIKIAGAKTQRSIWKKPKLALRKEREGIK